MTSAVNFIKPYSVFLAFITLSLVCVAYSGAVMAGGSQEVVLAQAETSEDEAPRDEHKTADHEVTPAMFKELREKMPIYREYSDERILEDMAAMPSMDVYVSGERIVGDVGVLMLAHGFREELNAKFEEIIGPVAETRPTAVAYGMAMMTSANIQSAIDRLESAGAKTIVVLPIDTLMDSKMVRQWQYVFGLRDEAQYMSVSRVRTNAKIVFAEKPSEHPVIASIMLDHARELSTDPTKEVLILVSHGPTRDEDNVKELAVLERHAQWIRDNSEFSEVKAFSLQDDAPTVILDANVKQLRSMIEMATADGKRVVMVTNLILLPTFAKNLKQHLEGLDFQLSDKGVLLHPAMVEWIEDVVAQHSTDG